MSGIKLVVGIAHSPAEERVADSAVEAMYKEMNRRDEDRTARPKDGFAHASEWHPDMAREDHDHE